MIEKHEINKIFDSIEEELHTAVICDILDELGYRDQAAHGIIEPIEEDYRLYGKVKTILSYDVNEMPESPYQTEIEAVDTIEPGDVVVIGTNHFGGTGNFSNGIWGELMATAAIGHGGRGVVLDGAVRDVAQLKKMGDKFKVFAAGKNPLDSKGRCLVAGYNVPIICDGVKVKPGDFVFADVDGVVFIPAQVHDEVIKRALEKNQKENGMREDLLEGMPLKEAFKKHKIL